MLTRPRPLRSGTLQDVAQAALFLASSGAAYITGQTLMVNGSGLGGARRATTGWVGSPAWVSIRGTLRARLEPVAMGGMGTVWCVLDRADTHQLKAAKILRQSDAASLLRFVREQSVRLNHSHVVSPRRGPQDGTVLIASDLMRGGSLHSLLGDFGRSPTAPSPPSFSRLSGLQAVHDAELIHRDVKPANLLLRATGQGMPHLRLTDFGIAIPLDEPRMTRTSMIVGSPGYMAPEQWRGADPDERADIYSVGRVGIQMLTGLRPPAEDTDVDLSAQRTGDAGHDGHCSTCSTAPSRATRPTVRSPPRRCGPLAGPRPHLASARAG